MGNVAFKYEVSKVSGRRVSLTEIPASSVPGGRLAADALLKAKDAAAALLAKADGPADAAPKGSLVQVKPQSAATHEAEHPDHSVAPRRDKQKVPRVARKQRWQAQQGILWCMGYHMLVVRRFHQNFRWSLVCVRPVSI